MINAPFPRWLKRSKDFGFDTSSSASSVLLKLRRWQRESKMRGRMTFINWNKPATLSVGERCFCFHVKAGKGGSPSQSQASFQSFVFTFFCHKWYHSSLWNVQYLLQIFGICNFCKWWKPKMMWNTDLSGKKGTTAIFCFFIFWGVFVELCSG